jgi:hypothetical protein
VNDNSIPYLGDILELRNDPDEKQKQKQKENQYEHKLNKYNFELT